MRIPMERAAPPRGQVLDQRQGSRERRRRAYDPADFYCPETFDVGADTNSPLANDYFHLAPLRFEGELTCVS